MGDNCEPELAEAGGGIEVEADIWKGTERAKQLKRAAED